MKFFFMRLTFSRSLMSPPADAILRFSYITKGRVNKEMTINLHEFLVQPSFLRLANSQQGTKEFVITLKSNSNQAYKGEIQISLSSLSRSESRYDFKRLLQVENLEKLSQLGNLSLMGVLANLLGGAPLILLILEEPLLLSARVLALRSTIENYLPNIKSVINHNF